MSRTSKLAVQALLTAGNKGGDGQQNWDGVTDLQPFIDTASAVVDRIVTCAANRNKPMQMNELELIERWLAAHYYSVIDLPYQTHTTQGASANFQGKTNDFIQSTHYGQTALRLDWSGCLESIDRRKTAFALWLGKPVSQQIPYDQRD